MPFRWIRTPKEDQQFDSQEQSPATLKSNPILTPYPNPGYKGSWRAGEIVVKQRRGFLGTIWLAIKVVLALALGFGVCYALFHFDVLSMPEAPVLTEERKTITVKELQNVIVPASDLITLRYHYKEAGIVRDANDFMGIELPLTQDIEIISYEGVVGVGLDVSDVEFEVSEAEAEGEKGSIVVKLPNLKVVQNEIDLDSFEVETVQQTPFNPQNIGNTTELLAKLEKVAKKRVLKDDEFMASARNNAVTILQNFLVGANVGAYYDIEFVWEQEA